MGSTELKDKVRQGIASEVNGVPCRLRRYLVADGTGDAVGGMEKACRSVLRIGHDQCSFLSAEKRCLKIRHSVVKLEV